MNKSAWNGFLFALAFAPACFSATAAGVEEPLSGPDVVTLEYGPKGAVYRVNGKPAPLGLHQGLYEALKQRHPPPVTSFFDDTVYFIVPYDVRTRELWEIEGLPPKVGYHLPVIFMLSRDGEHAFELAGKLKPELATSLRSKKFNANLGAELANIHQFHLKSLHVNDPVRDASPGVQK